MLCFVYQNDQCWIVSVGGLKMHTVNRLNVAAFTDINLDIRVRRKLLRGSDSLTFIDPLRGGHARNVRLIRRRSQCIILGAINRLGGRSELLGVELDALHVGISDDVGGRLTAPLVAVSTADLQHDIGSRNGYIGVVIGDEHSIDVPLDAFR